MSNCTYIDGIASCVAVDTAGEVVDLNGLDCSSLTGAAMNWEHKADTPSQIVGKILKVKKIFSEKDCEDDRQKHFWDKCKMPFLYILGRLFDDKKDSAKEAAALFLDDMQHPDEQPMVGFSIEGQKINKSGMVITHSIARKTTITCAPANKLCVAEMVPASGNKPKDDLDGIFKTETFVEIELLTKNESTNLWELMKKEKPKLKKDIGLGLSGGGASTALSGVAPMSSGGIIGKAERKLSLASKDGTKIGRTKSGRDVMSHGRVGEYGFNALEHEEAAAIHDLAAKASKDPRLSRHHADKAKLHMGAARTGKDTWERRQVKDKDIAAKRPSKSTPSSPKTSKLHDPNLSGKVSYKKSEKMAKALDAGSMNAAPGQLTGGAVLGRESMGTKMQNVTMPKQPPIKPQNVNRPDADFGSITHKPGTPDKGPGKVIMKNKDMKKARVDEGKTPEQKAWDRSGRHIRHDTEKVTTPPSKIGSFLGQKPKVETRERVHSKATHPSTRRGSQATPGHGPVEAYGRTFERKVVGLPTSGGSKGAGPIKKLPKSEMLQRAEEEYAKWSKREEFESFMAKRMPGLTKVEIQAIGKTLALSKSIRAEKKLAKFGGSAAGAQNYMHSYVAKNSKMNKALKFGTPEEQKAIDIALEERKKNPPKKVAPKPKAPDLDREVHSEVTHTSPMYGENKYEIVHLKSGHELHGHPKGKFKAGDKVVAKPHLMGTHIIEHKK